MIFVSVSKIFTFAFFHLVISGVSYYSCFWLELVPLVIILASVSSPGSPALSRVSVVRVLSAGKLSSCREGTQRLGAQICLLSINEGLKTRLSRCFSSPRALLSRVVSKGPRMHNGSLTCSGGQTPRCFYVHPLTTSVSETINQSKSILS